MKKRKDIRICPSSSICRVVRHIYIYVTCHIDTNDINEQKRLSRDAYTHTHPHFFGQTAEPYTSYSISTLLSWIRPLIYNAAATTYTTSHCLTHPGCFVIPPRDGEMKVARHALGYYNPKTIKGWRTGSPDRIVSVPRTPVTHPNDTLPEEGELALRNWMKVGG